MESQVANTDAALPYKVKHSKESRFCVVLRLEQQRNFQRGRDGSVVIATGYWQDGRWIEAQFLAETNDCSLLYSIQTGPVLHAAF
jgi:hypothetical protein